MQMSARGGNLQALLNFNFAPLLPMHLTMHCCMPSLFPKTFKTLKIVVLARPRDVGALQQFATVSVTSVWRYVGDFEMCVEVWGGVQLIGKAPIRKH